MVDFITDTLKIILSEEGVFVFACFALVIWILWTNNNRELRYIDIINKFTERFDNIEDKMEQNEKSTDEKMANIHNKVDLILELKRHDKE